MRLRELSTSQDQITTESQEKIDRKYDNSDDLAKLKEAMPKFIKLCRHMLNLPRVPKIIFINDERDARYHHSFGRFDPYRNKIFVNTWKRHTMDILRTLAHELVHFKQGLKKGAHNLDGSTGSVDENQANAVAGTIMRQWGINNRKFFKAQTMKIRELFETATAGATSAGNIASLGGSPHRVVGSPSVIKRWGGSPGKMGKSPKYKKPKLQTAKDNPIINPKVGSNLINE